MIPPETTTTPPDTNDSESTSSWTPITLKPISYFKSVFSRKNATPRQGSLAPNSKGHLQLIPDTCFGKLTTHHSLIGLEEFSHLWIIYIFHDNGQEYSLRNCQVKPKVTPPRLNGKKVGVFATRAPHRPNPVGLTLAKIESVDLRNSTVHVSGIDLIDGTPVIDIKPFIPDYDNAYQLRSSHLVNQATLQNNDEATSNSTRVELEDVEQEQIVRVPSWITQSPVKPIDNIVFTLEAIDQLKQLVEQDRLQFYQNWRQARVAIEQILYLDPRSVHRRKKCADQTYWFHLDGMNISVKIDDPSNVVEQQQMEDQGNNDNTNNINNTERQSITATVFKVEMWQDLLDSLGIDDESTRKKK